ncbi:hypothetical protein EHS25_003957 [Saitozyma podzolica]|uniref:DSBA-like thioredoxin domain-containing protein n=1 Tax=Saitozyma podzolica TaxID=1890683 RepID=A0A427YSP4_9TREE|nr:hypothetical protein EHS25_003957 [Saitozyma podzolica]
MSVLPHTNNAVASSSKVRMKIDVTSDVISPFCLIGMKQLQAAVEKFRALHPSVCLEPTIRFLPFELNPGLSEVPVSRRLVLEKKFGKERATAIIAMVDEKLRALGVEPHRGNPDPLRASDTLTSSTHLVHRLQTYTLLHHPDLQLALAMDLLTAYHQSGFPPSDRQTLADIAVKHRVFPSRDDALRFLEGDECDAAVRRAYVISHTLGVTGVPFFVFQDQYAARGAMGVDEFVSSDADETHTLSPRGNPNPLSKTRLITPSSEAGTNTS